MSIIKLWTPDEQDKVKNIISEWVTTLVWKDVWLLISSNYWNIGSKLDMSKNQIEQIFSEITNSQIWHPSEMLADYELHLAIIKRIKDDDFFSKLLMEKINIDTIRDVQMFLLEALRDANVDYLQSFERLLNEAPFNDFIWKNFIRRWYEKIPDSTKII